MTQPDELKKDEQLLWSPGRGTDVWDLFRACIEGDLEGVKGLLVKDPALVRCNYAYRTPIYFAVREFAGKAIWRRRRSSSNTARICMRATRTSVRRRWGWAARFGQIAMVELLLSRGAKPNLPDDPPWATPLAWATRRGHSEVAELLKEHGAG